MKSNGSLKFWVVRVRGGRIKVSISVGRVNICEALGSILSVILKQM